MKTNNIVIVGGGMVGLFCAYYLADKQRKVTILERGKVGEGASHGNCGLLMFSDIHPLCSPGTIRYEILRQLKRSSPLSIKPGFNLPLWRFLYQFARNCNPRQYHQATQVKKTIIDLSKDLFITFFNDHPFVDYDDNGLYIVCRTRAGFEKYRAFNQTMADFGLDAELLNTKNLLEREPAIKDDVAGGFFHHGDHCVRPDGLVTHLKDILLKKGVVFEEGKEVTGFSFSGNRLEGLLTSSGEFEADQFIISAGAWSTGLLKNLGVSIPVQPGKGYSITMARPDLCPKIPCYCYERSVVATPFEKGFRLGGTMEFSGWDDSLNLKRLDNIRKAAPEYLKEPFGIPVIEEWTSFRPMSPDDLPIITRLAGNDNVILATGHGMLGITLATGTGKLIAQMVQESVTDIPVEPFSIERFGK